MKIKINWGIGIGIFFTIFVLFLVFNLVFSSFNQVELVEGNYYQQELAYQKKIDKEKRTKKLNEQIKIIKNESAIIVQFPETMNKTDIAGEITMYRPSNNKLDKKFKVSVSEGNFQIINTSSLAKGLWKMKIDWSFAGTEFYNEESINI